MPPLNPKPLRFLHWSLIATTVLAAALMAATVWLGVRARSEDEWVRHTLAVRNQITLVMTLVQQAESSQRGFLLTARDSYLDPYGTAVKATPGALDDLSALVADNPRQQDAADKLRQLIDEKLHELRSTVDEIKAGRKTAAINIVESDRGQQLMDQIGNRSQSMQREEDRLLTARRENSTTLSMLLQIGATSAFLVICAVGALVGFLTRRSFAALGAAHDQLVATNRQLIEQMEQREQAEAQLRQVQKMKAIGELTGGIAHDFNNMLGVITGSLDLMQRRLKTGDFNIERFIDAAQQAAKRSASLTHRLLAFARQQPLAPEAIDANKMIGNMSDLLHSTLGEHIHIETVTTAGLWPAHADTHQLENALLNIAINARDAMPDGGKLTIETGNAYLDEAYCRQHGDVAPGQFVMIAVTDTGAGMTPEVVAHAFDPFFTTKPVGSGTGLGLSQVYGFVKQSHGHIKIYSEIGAGTAVKIYLPRRLDASREVVRKAVAPVQTAADGEVILLVEDDALMRRLATEALRELAYTVLDCANAETALAVLDDRPDISLLFTDVVMPGTNGKTLADDATRRRPGLKVLFTTGYTPNAVVHGGVLDAGVHLLTKPFTLEQLSAKVRAVLDG